MKQQAHFFISGRVQGVGFRRFVLKQARRLGVCGDVRNTEMGEVEVRAVADAKLLDEFILVCRRGCFWSVVSELSFDETAQMQEYNFKDFQIVR